MKRACIFTGFIILLYVNAVSQNSVLDLFRTRLKIADRSYTKKDFLNAIVVYESILAGNKDSAYIKLQIARSFYHLNRKPESAQWYFRVEDTLAYSPEDIFNIAEILLAGEQEDAKDWYKKYQKEKPEDSRTGKKLEALYHIHSFYADSLSYEVRPLPVNSEASDFFPYVINDKLLFLSDRNTFALVKRFNASEQSPFLGIFEAEESGGGARMYSRELNTGSHEGPFCFLENGKKIIFTRSGRKNKNLMLFMAENEKGKWKNITPLRFNSRSYSVSHPFFSSKDSCLYFVSDMPGGYGGTDIYKSRLRNKTFESPVNIGPVVNTEGNELFPAVQNNRFYFASDGHGGLGGLDIFYLKNDQVKFPEIINPGFPLNSCADDFSIFFTGDDRGYFSSNREEGKGKDDIYGFVILHQDFMFKTVEKFNHESVRNVKLTLLESEKTLLKDSLIADFPFSMKLKPGKTYELMLSKEGYKLADSVFDTPRIPIPVLSLDIPMERRNKVFIQGRVKSVDGAKVGNSSVKILNREFPAENIITSADEAGEFVAEIDPDYSFTIIAGNDSLIGVTTIPAYKKRRGTSVLSCEIQCGTSQTKDISLLVIDPVANIPVPWAEVWVKNNFSGEQVVLVAGQNGQAKLRINELFQYTLTPVCSDSGGDPVLVSYSDDEVILKLK